MKRQNPSEGLNGGSGDLSYGALSMRNRNLLPGMFSDIFLFMRWFAIARPGQS